MFIKILKIYVIDKKIIVLKYRMRYMIFEYKYLEYGKIFGNLMDLLEVIVYSIYVYFIG